MISHNLNLLSCQLCWPNVLIVNWSSADLKSTLSSKQDFEFTPSRISVRDNEIEIQPGKGFCDKTKEHVVGLPFYFFWYIYNTQNLKVYTIVKVILNFLIFYIAWNTQGIETIRGIGRIIQRYRQTYQRTNVYRGKVEYLIHKVML